MHRTRRTFRLVELSPDGERAVVMGIAHAFRMIANISTHECAWPPSFFPGDSIRETALRVHPLEGTVKAGREPLMVLCVWTPSVARRRPGSAPASRRLCLQHAQNSLSRRGAPARTGDIP